MKENEECVDAINAKLTSGKIDFNNVEGTYKGTRAQNLAFLDWVIKNAESVRGDEIAPTAEEQRDDVPPIEAEDSTKEKEEEVGTSPESRLQKLLADQFLAITNDGGMLTEMTSNHPDVESSCSRYNNDNTILIGLRSRHSPTPINIRAEVNPTLAAAKNPQIGFKEATYNSTNSSANIIIENLPAGLIIPTGTKLDSVLNIVADYMQDLENTSEVIGKNDEELPVRDIDETVSEGEKMVQTDLDSSFSEFIKTDGVLSQIQKQHPDFTISAERNDGSNILTLRVAKDNRVVTVHAIPNINILAASGNGFGYFDVASAGTETPITIKQIVTLNGVAAPSPEKWKYNDLEQGLNAILDEWNADAPVVEAEIPAAPTESPEQLVKNRLNEQWDSFVRLQLPTMSAGKPAIHAETSNQNGQYVISIYNDIGHRYIITIAPDVARMVSSDDNQGLYNPNLNRVTAKIIRVDSEGRRTPSDIDYVPGDPTDTFVDVVKTNIDLLRKAPDPLLGDTDFSADLDDKDTEALPSRPTLTQSLEANRGSNYLDWTQRAMGGADLRNEILNPAKAAGKTVVIDFFDSSDNQSIAGSAALRAWATSHPNVIVIKLDAQSNAGKVMGIMEYPAFFVGKNGEIAGSQRTSVDNLNDI